VRDAVGGVTIPPGRPSSARNLPRRHGVMSTEVKQAINEQKEKLNHLKEYL
jgi:hypothetical protein